MYSTLLNIYLFSMLMFFHESTCCSCLVSHTQTAYCNSDFVIRAIVLSNKTETKLGSTDGLVPFVQREVVYTVKVLAAFRFDGSYEDYSAVKIHTADNSAACGVYLELGSEYLLTGKIMKDKRRINLCGWNSRWEKVDSCVRDYLIDGIYEENCKCQIANCFEEDKCEALKTKNSCVMDRWQPTTKVWTSVCKSEKIGYNRNTCSWTHCPTAPTIPKAQ